MQHHLAVVGMLTAAVFAQDKPKLDARSFVPADYRCECFVDFAALDASGMWAAIRKSPVGVLLGSAEKELGFEFASLKTLRAFPELLGDEPQPEGRRSGGIAIFDGNDDVTLPPREAGGGFEETQLHGVPALVDKREWAGPDPDVWLLPRKGLLVLATTHMVMPILEGTQKGGVPNGEFLSLLAAKGDVAHVVAALNRGMTKDGPLQSLQSLWTDADHPSYVLARMRMVTDAKDQDAEPQVVLEVIVRSATGKAVPMALKPLAEQGLEALKKHKQLGALKALWNKVELAVDGRDVKATLPLGRARDAAGALTSLLGPLMMYGMVTAEAQPVLVPAVEVVPVEPPAPPPPPAPQPGGQRRGGN